MSPGGRPGLSAKARFIVAVTRGMHKLRSRVFPENIASRLLLKRLGFAGIDIHRRHRDRVIVAQLLATANAEKER